MLCKSTCDCSCIRSIVQSADQRQYRGHRGCKTVHTVYLARRRRPKLGYCANQNLDVSLLCPPFILLQGPVLTYHRTIEVNLAIICGCLPVLQPLFRKIPLLIPFLPSHLRSKLSGGHSAMEHSSWPSKLTGPRRAGQDVERGEGGRKAPWREPDEMSESGSSVQSLYHHYQQQPSPVIRSALEPATVRTERTRSVEGGLRGVAL